MSLTRDTLSNPDAPPPSHRTRFELIFFSVGLALGLFVLPAIIYAVGVALLGPYGENAGLGRFYTDFFADLAEPSGRAWTLALGPLVLMGLIRLIFLGVQRSPEASIEDSIEDSRDADEPGARHSARNPAPGSSERSDGSTDRLREPSSRRKGSARVEPRVGTD